jgi:ASC-1-like (ASCH) protein
VEKSEERIKRETEIFELYLNCLNESVSDRQKSIGQLWDLLVRWHKKYLIKESIKKIDKMNIEIFEMGAELFEVINNFLGKNKTDIPKSKDEFFKYLTTSLFNKTTEYKRKEVEVRVSREKMKKLKNVNDLVMLRERHLQRELTNNEKRQLIQKWFNINEYNELSNMLSMKPLDFTVNDGDQKHSILDLETTKSFTTSLSSSPIDNLSLEKNTQMYKDAIENVLEEMQERSRDCSRALITMLFLENGMDIEELYSVFDKDVLNSYKTNKKTPNQYDIYLKYHPDAKAPEVSASTNLKNLKKKLENYLPS